MACPFSWVTIISAFSNGTAFAVIFPRWNCIVPALLTLLHCNPRAALAKVLSWVPPCCSEAVDCIALHLSFLGCFPRCSQRLRASLSGIWRDLCKSSICSFWAVRNPLAEDTEPKYQFSPAALLVKECLLGKKKERGKQIMKIMNRCHPEPHQFCYMGKGGEMTERLWW